MNSKFKEVNRGEIDTRRKTLQYYDQCVNSARSLLMPNRSQLIKLYYELGVDPHFKSVFGQRRDRITSLEFGVYTKSGKIDSKLTEVLKQEWFYDFLNMCMDSIIYGNSLIEISNADDKIQSWLFPRECVIPEKGMLKKNYYDYEGAVNYKQPYFWNLIEVNNNNDSRDLGELLGLSKILLFKNEVITSHAQYIDRAAQPVVKITTTQVDPDIRHELHQFAQNLGRAGYLICDPDTNFEFVVNPQNNSSIFTDFETFANSEISKHLLGATMITDSGSSYSQSMTHMQASYILTKSDIRNLENVINNKLIPILIRMNELPNKYLNVKFTEPEPEVATFDDKMKIYTFLRDTFGSQAIDTSMFEEKYGIKINKDLIPQAPINTPISDGKTSQD